MFTAPPSCVASKASPERAALISSCALHGYTTLGERTSCAQCLDWRERKRSCAWWTISTGLPPGPERSPSAQQPSSLDVPARQGIAVGGRRACIILRPRAARHGLALPEPYSTSTTHYWNGPQTSVNLPARCWPSG